MFDRHKYKEPKDNILPTSDDHVGMIKYDGGSYFVPVDQDGNIRFISRRESVKGGFPDKTDRVPHLAKKTFPEFAGHVFNVELIHTGLDKNSVESHRQLSGILNSLPERAVATQKVLGPVRAVLHNVINPEFATFKDKYEHMKKFEEAFGNKDLMFAPELHFGKSILELSEKTKRQGREGIIVTHWTEPEPVNPRIKQKHKMLYNLRISKIIQEIDINGNPKDSMGAVEVVDATDRVVGAVGTGWSRADRIDAWNNPDKWIGRLIQVESMGLAANRLRMPVYNGDADGDIDVVKS